MKQSPICPECSSWMNIKIVNNIEWLYCSQGHHVRVIKKNIGLLSQKEHADSADEYRKRKKNE